MKKILIFIFSFIFNGLAIFAQKNPDLETVISHLQANYKKIKTYSAQFEQEVRQSQFARTISQGKGELFYSKPGKMVWHYTEPEEHWYITDGKTFWDYLPSLKQVLVLSIDQALAGNLPKSFLFGMGELEKDFEIKFDSSFHQPQAGTYYLILVPKKEKDRLLLGTIKLVVDAKTFLVKEARLKDQLGNENILRFSQIKINPKIEEKIFHFQPPKGVEIITPTPSKIKNNSQKEKTNE